MAEHVHGDCFLVISSNLENIFEEENQSELTNSSNSEKWREVRRERACVLVKGAGQPGVQSEWVGTTMVSEASAEML